MTRERSKCCTCGYEWFTGLDGSHQCSTELLKKIDRLEKIEAAAFDVLAYDWGENDDDAVETIIRLRSAVDA